MNCEWVLTFGVFAGFFIGVVFGMLMVGLGKRKKGDNRYDHFDK